MNRQVFLQLLEQVLQGDENALQQWDQYQDNKKFSDDFNRHAIFSIQRKLRQNPKDVHALHLRALMHQLGQGGAVDHAAAIDLYEQVIALGNKNAMNKRALMYKLGKGGAVDYAAAIDLYERAIVLGSSAAMSNRAWMHHHGQGGKVDYAAAIALYEQAIALGCYAAMVNRAWMHKKGQGGKFDYAAAIALDEQSIALGSHAAMVNRAYMHHHGEGGKVDYAAAIVLYEQAIALGYSKAMDNRAMLHRLGQGGVVDLAAAVALYKQSYFTNQNEDTLIHLKELFYSADDMPVEARYALILCYLKDQKIDKAKKLYANYGIELKPLFYPSLYQYIKQLPDDKEFTQQLIDFVRAVGDDTNYQLLLHYKQFKVALFEQSYGNAFKLYRSYLENELELTAGDYYHLGHVCFAGIEKLAPHHKVKRWEQGCAIFLKGAQQGDSDCKMLLMQLLHSKEAMENNLAQPGYVFQKESQELIDQYKALTDRFILKMEQKEVMKRSKRAQASIRMLNCFFCSASDNTSQSDTEESLRITIS